MIDPLEQMIRHEGGRVLATLVRLTGDFTLAEDAVQDAVVQALQRWPRDGLPHNPAAWLTTVARNRALDVLRREARRTTKETDARLLDQVELVAGERTTDSMVRDDLLRLLFTCCHPALSFEARTALALRTLCGMTTGEIAAAYLVPESTMGQRISRAKQKIATARIPYRVPADHELPDRLQQVRLPQTHPTNEEQRVVGFPRVLGHSHCCPMRQVVVVSNHKRFKRVVRIQKYFRTPRSRGR